MTGSSSAGSSANGTSSRRTENGSGESSSNGHHLNGSSASASAQGGGADPDSFEDQHHPFASTSTFRPIYPGSQIDRQELVRLTLQCLQDAGYPQAAATLSKESGYALESPTITTFRNGVLDGKWETVARLLQDEMIVEGESLNTVRFLIAEQKFLEHLESRTTKKALSVLRNELAPLNHNPERLHQLSSYMMCASPEDLRERSGWLGAGEPSRRKLLESLQQHISASVMIPQRRLETLLEQAKEQQRASCRYHTSDPNTPFSLFADHMCDRNVFPTINTHILDGHSDEVWRIAFSNAGDLLASASQDGTLMIWNVKDGFSRLHTIQAAEHAEYITSVAWSPDDTMLLLGVENAVKIIDVLTGRCTLNVIRHDYCAVGGVAWLPNSAGFFSGGLDMRLLCWDLDGQVMYAFSTNPYRIVDIAVAPDSSRLVCLGEASHVHKGSSSGGQIPHSISTGNGANTQFEVKERRIIIFNLKMRMQERSISHPTALTCVSFAPNSSRHALINQAPDEVVLYDVIDGTVAKRYQGQQQGKHMIRSCFGGASKSFIISGSEDAMVYVWHKDSIQPLEVLAGHGKGSVNDVSWNPSSSGMFASAGDDKTIRIWQAPSNLHAPS